MHLNNLSLVNFKNYSEANLEFSEGINCFVGDNGMGKTNLLDAIYYLSFCKSFYNPIDSNHIKHGEDLFVIQGNFLIDGTKEQIYCGLQKGKKKQFKRNKKDYPRLADHIGQFPAVIVSPEDHDLITGGSEVRRKFMDTIISQLDKGYLDDLIYFNRVLLQRNSLLKQFAEKRTFDRDSLEVWDMQLVEKGERIFQKRQEFVQKFIPEFQRYYTYISSGSEQVGIDYQSQLIDQDYSALLEHAVGKDRIVKYTTVGTHRDDLVFKIGDHPIKKFGSQGQQKSFVVALKLAQFDFIKSVKSFMPVLLLDDIFDRLDPIRVEKLMQLVSDHNFGQIFITHTHRERLERILGGIDVEHRFFDVTSGTVST
jgi:DNA replication and repair protein RecF